MPNIKSAKKRVLVNETKHLQNKMFKSAMKTELKALRAEATAENVSATYSLADKAVVKGAMHKNKAARVKSQAAKAAKAN